MTVTPRLAPPDEEIGEKPIEVLRLTPEEWRASAQAELDELGLTYAELERQAADEDFVSYDAKCLWLMISGTL